MAFNFPKTGSPKPCGSPSIRQVILPPKLSPFAFASSIKAIIWFEDSRCGQRTAEDSISSRVTATMEGALIVAIWLTQALMLTVDW